ncbi:MAG: HIT family protein [Pseudomonadota bacterium]
MANTPHSNVLQTPELTFSECFFCQPKSEEILHENELALCLVDNHPVVKGHCLFIPKRHAPTYFDLTPDEVLAINELTQRARERLMTEDPTITGFNLGTNMGSSGGQSVFHCHFHLFPRRDGDQDNPRGGVRRIFPEKARYN